MSYGRAVLTFLFLMIGVDIGHLNSQEKVPDPVTILRKSVAVITSVYRDGAEIKQFHGTGFFVVYVDQRLGKNMGFSYFVTNRHIAEPIIDGRRVVVDDIFIRHNPINPTPGVRYEGRKLSPAQAVKWYLSPDKSVDLAVIPFMIAQEEDDITPIPTSWFATKKIIEEEGISVGEEILFAGLFYQFPGNLKFQPIVRHGVLAMMPEDKIMGTLGEKANLYLADAHAFHGNSGSPVFVNVGYNQQTGRRYSRFRLLGIVSGYVIEHKDFQVTVSTTLSGTFPANSDVATVVPTDELMAILDLPELANARDAAVAKLLVPRGIH